MNTLREAAQAALKEMEHANAVLLRQAGVGIIDMNAIDRLRAALVAAREREACAELVEKGVWAGCWVEETRELSEEVAEAIRARAEKETA